MPRRKHLGFLISIILVTDVQTQSRLEPAHEKFKAVSLLYYLCAELHFIYFSVGITLQAVSIPVCIIYALSGLALV